MIVFTDRVVEMAEYARQEIFGRGVEQFERADRRAVINNVERYEPDWSRCMGPDERVEGVVDIAQNELRFLQSRSELFFVHAKLRRPVQVGQVSIVRRGRHARSGIKPVKFELDAQLALNQGRDWLEGHEAGAARDAELDGADLQYPQPLGRQRRMIKPVRELRRGDNIEGEPKSERPNGQQAPKVLQRPVGPYWGDDGSVSAEISHADLTETAPFGAWLGRSQPSIFRAEV